MASLHSPEYEPTIDDSSIVASYAPPEASLTAPPSSPHLEDLVPSTETSTISIDFKGGSVPFSYIEPTVRSTKITHLDVAPLLSDAGVRGMVTSVSHGTFNFRPATLIAFSFAFRSGGHAFRFKNANIKITFSQNSPRSKERELSSGPAVVKFAPRKIYGLPTTEGKKNTIGGEFTMQVPAGVLMTGPGVHAERESEYEMTHRFSTVGNFWSSKRGSDWDIVYWDIKENKRTKHGIPDRFNCAVIVERDAGERGKTFAASVEVTVDTPIGNGFFGRPWTKDRPVVFRDGIEMGSQPRTKDFEKLTEEDWKVLVPSDEEWQDRLTDVATNKGLDVVSSLPESI